MLPETVRSAYTADLETCREMLQAGSKSFFFASRLLPRTTRDATTAFYAFCRLADDLVDEPEEGAQEGVVAVRQIVDRVFDGTPGDHPVERALAVVVHKHTLPRGPFDALIEGFEWDRDGRNYRTLPDLVGYCVRVASSVGVVMACLMGRRGTEALGRAVDLGVAMQLSNIARDVAEDANRGRIYLPTVWLDEGGLQPETIRAGEPVPEAVAPVVTRLLQTADAYYASGLRGIALLPWRYRWAIRAAALIYRDIGRVIRLAPVTMLQTRAATSAARKLLLATRALWPARLGGQTASSADARFMLLPSSNPAQLA